MRNLFLKLSLLVFAFVTVVMVLSCSSDNDEDVTVKEPISKFASAVEDLTVTFTNHSENAQSYEWDFGDSNTSTEVNPTHTYSADGTYTVKLTAEGSGKKHTFTAEVEVKSSNLAANFSFKVEDLKVTFTNNSEDAESYKWDFGDLNTSTEDNPTHTYSIAGTYIVKLTAIGLTKKHTLTAEIEVKAPENENDKDDPVAKFSFTKKGLTVTFINESKNADTYFWEFGDEKTSTEIKPVHKYLTAGTYTVKLTAKGSDKEHVFSAEVKVENPGDMPNMPGETW